jgi:hypothetical protein
VLLLGADVRVGAEAVPVYADDDDDEQLVCGTASTPIAQRRNVSKLYGHYAVVPGRQWRR